MARITGSSHLEVTGGTGAYEAVTGSGQVSFHAVSIGQRTPDGCSRTNARTYSFAYITGLATIPG